MEPPPAPSPSGGHFDDETLSASLDDALDSAVEIESHLATCAACRSRQADLAAAARQVAAALPSLPPTRAAALVAQAIESAALSPAPRSTVAHRRRPRRRPAIRPGWVAGVAAALVLVLAMPTLRWSLRASGTDTESAQDGAESSATSGGRTENLDQGVIQQSRGAESLAEQSRRSGRQPAADTALADMQATDLGNHTNAEVLATRVRAVLSERPADAVSSGAPTTSPPASGARLAAVQCAPVVREQAGAVLTGGRYVGSARWLGEPSVVVAFDMTPPAPGATSRLYVLRPAGCTVLATAQW